jgi:hypothetical protein
MIRTAPDRFEICAFLTDGSRLQEHPDRGGGGDPDDDPKHPVAADQEHEGQQHEYAGNQRRSSQDTVARACSSAAGAHRVASTPDLTNPSQHDEVSASSQYPLERHLPIRLAEGDELVPKHLEACLAYQP